MKKALAAKAVQWCVSRGYMAKDVMERVDPREVVRKAVLMYRLAIAKAREEEEKAQPQMELKDFRTLTDEQIADILQNDRVIYSREKPKN